MTENKKGFTLIELLIVIAIITILAAATIVGINPGQRFRAARNATRWSHMNSIVTAIVTFAAENEGAWPNDYSETDCIGPWDSVNGTSTWICIGTDPIAWCATGTPAAPVLIPDYISGLPAPPSPGECYNIGFANAEETSIRIISDATEAIEEGVEVTR